MNLIKTTSIGLLMLATISCNDNDDNTVQTDGLSTTIEQQAIEIENLQSNFNQLRKNEELVKNFYQEFFGDLKFDEAGNKYLGDVYIQHNPNVADGKEALIAAAKIWFANTTPFTVDVRRVFASGDYVFIHTKSNSGENGTSVMDVFKVENDKLVEHWDTMQAIPSQAANDHPFFREI